ncbi:helix-turn-helix domain-containing protein [Desulfovibrio desulfuricans]|uniref:helix-turn-helix domain-containing protein n=1 Tax=Desulfovibrio desulfuricans TaxID=876 RepID=UPI0003B42D5E|nr:helix-turn-helix transcriptional regulator [Desulfovibrio desulfuricans]
MKLAELVGENITVRRRQLGLSQKELATLLGITQDAMTRMEKGKIAPKMSRLEDLAAHLQCPVSYFFRTQSDEVLEKATSIAEILMTVPDDGQEALVNLVAEAARVMNLKNEK